MSHFKSFDEEINRAKCERCKMGYAPIDLTDIGIPGICGFRVCPDCLSKMPEATQKMIADACVEWA